MTTTCKKATDLAPESAWFKSSYSSGSEGNCLESADLKREVGVRDSKDKEGPGLVFSKVSWTAFITSVIAGEPDVHA
ncbi:DUF397 domain-containing protein [Streptomyces sp. NPDC006739]|uniref:DUF397 domain-containing protein n=1 Tax=Streptomyces sp. NPDC006739 TaxID=3364763 RepID=UPI00368B998B